MTEVHGWCPLNSPPKDIDGQIIAADDTIAPPSSSFSIAPPSSSFSADGQIIAADDINGSFYLAGGVLWDT